MTYCQLVHPAMLMRTMLVFVLLISASGPSCLLADENERYKNFVTSFLAEYKSRPTLIKTLTCSTKVASFYPKGYMSEQLSEEGKKHNNPVDPPLDLRIANEPCSWAIDFTNQRIRKEFALTKPHYNSPNLTAAMQVETALHLFHDGKYRMFRPVERHPTKADLAGVLDPDVFLYEENAHAFLLCLDSLPLLWLAGGVNGRFPQPKKMQYLEAPERFSHRHDSQYRGHDCVVLTVQEQESNTAVREFWVGVEKPHPIYLCRIRNGTDLSTQIEVDYRRQGQYLVPVEWTCTYYRNGDNKLFEKITYGVDKMAINGALPESLFQKELAPGMLVLKPGDSSPFGVDRGGNLIPFQRPRRPASTKLWIWSCLALILFVFAAWTWRYVRRRSEVSR